MRLSALAVLNDLAWLQLGKRFFFFPLNYTEESGQFSGFVDVEFFTLAEKSVRFPPLLCCFVGLVQMPGPLPRLSPVSYSSGWACRMRLLATHSALCCFVCSSFVGSGETLVCLH